MAMSDTMPINTLSDSDFYRKIISKYQIGKIRTSRFPIIIFYKNSGSFLHKKMDLSVLFKIHLNNQNIVFPLIVKFKPSMKGMLSWLDNGKNTLQSAVEKKEVWKVVNVKNSLPSNLAFNQRTTHVAYSRDIPTNRRILNYGNNMKILSSQTYRERMNFRNCLSLNTAESFAFVNKEDKHKYLLKSPAILLQNNMFFYTAIPRLNELFLKNLTWVTSNKPPIKNFYGSFRHVSSGSVQRTYALRKGYYSSQSNTPAILSQDELFFNSTILGINTLLFKEPNQVTFNSTLSNNYYDSFGHSSFGSAQRTCAYKLEREIMRFQDSGRLEQEIEQIKKIVLQTKESISGKPTFAPGEADIKRYLDINRISDKVYQNIERTIRMERERRGM